MAQIDAAKIGEPDKEITVEPIKLPDRHPVKEPVPVEPVKTPEEEPVPA